jgi:lipopolysaccharide exporter
MSLTRANNIPTTVGDTSTAQLSVDALRARTTFRGDVLKVMSGTIVAQLLGICAAPFLTRIYAPDAYGIVALFTSITSILSVVACLRYELSIMLPERDEEAHNLLAVCLGFSVLIALLTVPAVWWGRNVIMRWLNASQLGPYLWLIPVMVFIQGLFLALNYWNSRTKHFGRLSLARVVGSSGTVTTKLVVGYAGHATGGTLIGAVVGGQALAACILSGQIWRNDGSRFRQTVRWREMVAGMKRYRKFPIYGTWAGLLNTTSTQLPSLLLAGFFSPIVVGFYALGHRILSMPLSLVGGSVGQVFYQRASVAMAEGNTAAVVEKTFRSLLSLAVLPFALLLVIGPDVFRFVFGERWNDAGIYAQILAPWLFFVFLGSPMSTLTCVLEKQEVGLLFDVVLMTSRIFSLVVGGVLGSITLALLLYSLSGTILWAWFCGYLVSHAGINPLAMARMVFQKGSVAAFFVIPSIFAKWVMGASPFVVTIVGLFSAVAYYGFAVWSDRDLRMIATSCFTQRK